MAGWSEPSAPAGRERSVPAIVPRRGQRGGALLEFIVVLPVLIMLVFGAWEFGRIFDAWLVSTNAAREGGRYGVEWIEDTDGPFQAYVRGKVVSYLNAGYGSRLGSGDVHIPAGNIVVEELADGEFRVIVTADVDVWAPAVAPLMGSSTYSVTAWATMRR